MNYRCMISCCGFLAFFTLFIFDDLFVIMIIVMYKVNKKSKLLFCCREPMDKNRKICYYNKLKYRVSD